jgi:beta-galactosidase/beta-glucuronidase
MTSSKYLPLALVALVALGASGSGAALAQGNSTDPNAILFNHAPLVTRWAKNVSKTSPHAEYPRPQMTRAWWMSLNGPWQFSAAVEGEATPFGRNLRERILVPFAMESQLSGIKRHHPHAWYRRTLSLPSQWNNQRVLLHFGGVDWETRVWVNGREVGSHRGAYDAFSCDITDALRPSAPQEVIVGVFGPTDKADQPRGKQVLKPEGIFYTPTTGIWQSVWMEPVPRASIESLRITPDLDARLWRLSVPLRVLRQAESRGLRVQTRSRLRRAEARFRTAVGARSPARSRARRGARCRGSARCS